MYKKILFLLFLFIFSIFSVYAVNVTFTVNQSTGAIWNLTGVNLDCNSGLYTLSNKTSPFVASLSTGTYSCTFSKTEWDSNTVTVVVGGSPSAQTVYMNKYVYQKIVDFNSTSASTNTGTYSNVGSWSFDANYGGTTNVYVGCSLWASNTAGSATAQWVLDSSNDNFTWTARGNISRTMNANTVAGSVYLTSNVFSITDGTRYLRLKHRITGGSTTLTTNNAYCVLFTDKDQNNFSIPYTLDARTATTISTTSFSNIGASHTFNAGAFNGFLFTIGSVGYSKTNPMTSSETNFKILRNASSVTTYPRYVTNNSSGVGGIAEFLNINNSSSTTTNYQGLSAVNSARFAYTANNYHLNQKSEEYEQRSLNSLTNNTRDWNQVACASFSDTVTRDILVVAVLPFKSNNASDLFESYLNATDGLTYDQNSFVNKRSGGSANQNGIMIYQHVFKDIESADINICIYAKSSLGTITFNGGNVLGLTVNPTTTTSISDYNATIVLYDLNLFQNGNLTQNVDLKDASDIDVIYDINAQGNAIDVNSITVYYRPPADDLNCYGYIRNVAQCGWRNETYTGFTVTQLDSNTYNFISDPDDDHAFKSWNYLGDPDLFHVNDGNFLLYGNNRWVKQLYTNIPFGNSYFYNFSFSATAPSNNYDLHYFDCNNDSPDPLNDSGCAEFLFASFTPKDIDGFYSIKYKLNDQNIIENSQSKINSGNRWIYFYCPNCTSIDNWKIDFVGINTNIDQTRNWTSVAGASLFTTSSNTHNFHFHYLDPSRDNNMQWYATLDNLAGTTFISDIYTESINEGNLPPIITAFNLPINNDYYSENVDINISVNDPNDDTLVCDFNVYDLGNDLLFNDTNILVTGNTCATIFDSTNFGSQQLFVIATVREYNTDFNFSVTSDPYFYIDNNAPITSFSGCDSDWYNTEKTITLNCLDVNGSGCGITQYRINNGSWTTYSGAFNLSLDGNNIIDYNSTDDLDNVESTNTNYCAIDTNNPRFGAFNFIDYNSIYNNYIKGPVSFVSDFNDLISGISVSDINTNSCEYTFDSGSNWYSADWNFDINSCQVLDLDLNTNELYVFGFIVYDNAGNHIHSTLTSTYISDSSAPISTDNAPEGIISGDILITINSNDSGSDVNYIAHCYDTENTCEPDTFTSGDPGFIAEVDLDCENECSYYIRYYAVDFLGNVEPIKSSGEIVIDNGAPEVGATTLSEFTIYNNYIKGTGNIIGGEIVDIDFNILTAEYTIDGTNYNLCFEDPNCDFNNDTNQIIISNITIEYDTNYIFNTKIAHDVNLLEYGFGIPTQLYISDLNAPITFSLTPFSLFGWEDSNVILPLIAQDLGSGVQNTYYCVDDSNSCDPITVGNSVDVTCSANSICTKYVRYYSTDNLDNNEFEESGLKIDTIQIDLNAPNTDINFSDTNWQNDNIVIEFTCDDYDASGCAYTEYRLDSGSWNQDSSVTINTDGNYLLEYRSIDLLNNAEEIKSTYIALDKTDPTFDILNDNEWFTAEYNLLFFDTNFDISGKQFARAGIDSLNDLNNTDSIYYLPIVLDGNNEVDYNFADNANNFATGLTYALLDTSLPETILSGCNSGWNNLDVNISLDANDNISGIDFTKYKINSGLLVSGSNLILNDDGNYLIEYYSRDNAGNDELLNSYYCALDLNAPIIGSINNTNIIFTYDFNVEFVNLDFGISDINFARYSLDSGDWEDMLNSDDDFFVEIIEDGNHSIDYNFVDNAGNITSGTVYALLDLEGPKLYDENWLNPINDYNFNEDYIELNGTVFVNLDVSDINAVWISFDGVTYYEANLIDLGNGDYNWDYNYFADLNGNVDFNIYIYAENTLGQRSPIRIREMHFDNQVIDFTLSANITRRTATITAILNESGYCKISNNDVSYAEADNLMSGINLIWNYYNLSSRTYTKYVICVDSLGNETSKSINFTIRSNNNSIGSSTNNVDNTNNNSNGFDLSNNDNNLIEENNQIILNESSELNSNIILGANEKLASSDEIELIKTADIKKVIDLNDIVKYDLNFTVLVRNKTNKLLRDVRIVDEIPKDIADNVNQIVFDEQPKIILADPLVEWTILELGPKQEYYFKYSIINPNKNIDSNLENILLSSTLSAIYIPEVNNIVLNGCNIYCIAFLGNYCLFKAIIIILAIVLILGLIIYLIKRQKHKKKHNWR